MMASEHELWGWENFFGEIDMFIGESGRHFGSCNADYARYALERYEQCVLSVSRLRRFIDNHTRSPALPRESRDILTLYRNEMEELSSCLRALYQEWHDFLERIERSESVAYQVPLEPPNSRRGRPRFVISRDQLEYLRSLSFTWTDISALLGVSRMTLFRRRVEFQMVSDPSRRVGDAELRTILSTIRQQLPHVGEKMVSGRLRSLGYHVTRERLRQAIRDTDPINCALRWQGVLSPRRPYSVPGPNSLWHIGEQGI